MSFRIQTGTGTFPATGVPAETQNAGPPQLATPGTRRAPDALEDLRSQPADGADFSSIASVAAAGQALDSRYLKMAGEPLVQSPTLPAALAEQHARYVLDSTLALINGLASELLAHSHEVFASGSLEQRTALALTLKRFLAQAQATMVGLVATSRAELTSAPSPDMLKLLTFCGHGLWQGLDALGLQLRNTFERQVMTAEGPVQASPAQREQACARLVADQSMQFKRQMDAIQLTSVKRPGFDPAALVGVVAMRAELATAIGGTAARQAPTSGPFAAFREPGRAPPSSPASSTSDGLVDDAFFAGLNDRDDLDADDLDLHLDLDGDPVGHRGGDHGDSDEMDTDDRHS
jgi:hypothetical protein